MRWLADDCVYAPVVRQLRTAGHDVLFTLELSPGAADPEIIRRASAEDRLLLTEDRDFGELVFRRGMQAPGIVHLRIDPEQRLLKWPQLETVIAAMGTKLFGRYTLVEPNRYRSRKLPFT